MGRPLIADYHAPVARIRVTLIVKGAVPARKKCLDLGVWHDLRVELLQQQPKPFPLMARSLDNESEQTHTMCHVTVNILLL